MPRHAVLFCARMRPASTGAARGRRSARTHLRFNRELQAGQVGAPCQLLREATALRVVGRQSPRWPRRHPSRRVGIYGQDAHYLAYEISREVRCVNWDRALTPARPTVSMARGATLREMDEPMSHRGLLLEPITLAQVEAAASRATATRSKTSLARRCPPPGQAGRSRERAFRASLEAIRADPARPGRPPIITIENGAVRSWSSSSTAGPRTASPRWATASRELAEERLRERSDTRMRGVGARAGGHPA